MSLGEPLITAGFGISANPHSELMINEDSDCKIISTTSLLIDDPDNWNKAMYKAWSMPVACDISHGDSGSAVISRTQDKVLGIIWTGGMPKKPEVRISSFIDSLIGLDNNDVWTQLEYMIPMSKIKEQLLVSKKDILNRVGESID